MNNKNCNTLLIQMLIYLMIMQKLNCKYVLRVLRNKNSIKRCDFVKYANVIDYPNTLFFKDFFSMCAKVCNIGRIVNWLFES